MKKQPKIQSNKPKLKPVADTMYPKVIERAKNTKSKIDINTVHRAKVIKSKQDILKALSDRDNEQIMPEPFIPTHSRIKGYKPPKDYSYLITNSIIILIAITIGYLIACNIK